MVMIPWLTSPVALHSSRDAGTCSLTPEQCAFKSSWWVFWYEADHRYALPTVALFLVAIILVTLGQLLGLLVPAHRRKSGSCFSRLFAFVRLLAAQQWRLGGWYTPSLGSLLLAMTLGPRPYYWPNTRELGFGNSPPIATRTGWMALGCMPFIYVLGSKANPVSALTRIPHEKLNLWHGWIAWAMWVLALIHTFPFIIYHIWKGDLVYQWNDGGVWVTGVVALLAQTWLTVLSISWLRNRYYEFFRFSHYVAALVFIIFLFFHCDFRLSSWDYFIATAVLYTLCWTYSQLKAFFEFGWHHRALIEAVSRQTLKITIPTSRVHWRTGQHLFLRFATPDADVFTAHPFTITSLPNALDLERSELVFYARVRKGTTKRLLARATCSFTPLSVPVLLEGPYGGVSHRHLRRLCSPASTTLLIGGGDGAVFTLPLIEHYLCHAVHDLEADAPCELRVVIATRDPELTRWYRAAVRSLVTASTMLPLGGSASEGEGKKKEEEEEESEGRMQSSGANGGLKIVIHETHITQDQNSSQKMIVAGVEKQPHSLCAEEEPQDGRHATLDEEGVGGKEALTAGVSLPVLLRQGRPPLVDIVGAEVERPPLSARTGRCVGVVSCGPASMAHDVSQAVASAQARILAGGLPGREIWLHQEGFSY
ncbi:ferric reductase family protein [Aspergillus brunneoviolaceus CBS 621.78]|uniref:Uncharacterized protein n=1 Tax=Aspergillus brunneoviolaceus CBS 621.78 TaxID=1450534 RepID=A0ACD1GL91_9EURO|nr:hypothetical protein BO95DRAFT_427920 [Aspergillus brunneoviolaceus CBS 621.78]RAH49997.1 hypothetical protein BO95DRAFT_427920 [Aspergillus brunneoviolaceus CBS 621.78]